MIPHREEHLDLCAGYVLGGLEAGAASELEAHLAGGCPECESAIADFHSAAAMLASSARPAPVPAGLKARVLAEAAAVRPPVAARGEAVRPAEARPQVIAMPRRASWGWSEWALAAAAVFLAVTSGWAWKTAKALEGQLAERQQRIADLTQQLDEERRWAEVLAAPGAEAASFSLTPDGAAALKARATYDPATRRAVIVFDGFTPPSGRDYQLWALKGQGVASLGLIKADASGHAVLRLENVGDAAELAGFAVSLEPAGGAPTPTAPTGPVVMAAKFAS